MAYEFFLGGELLPVTPSKLQIKINGGNKTLTLINDGEINLLKNPKLMDIEFDCELPHTDVPYAAYESAFRSSDYFLEVLEDLMSRRKPFQFVVSRHLPDGDELSSINVKVSLEDYRIIEDAKAGPCVIVKITLKQWRDYSVKTVKIEPPKESKPPEGDVVEDRPAETAPTPPAPQTYTVVKGDCL